VESAIAATQGQKILHQRDRQDHSKNPPIQELDNKDEILLREHEIKNYEIKDYLRKNLGWARLKQGRFPLQSGTGTGDIEEII
jgi:hypothetical protein